MWSCRSFWAAGRFFKTVFCSILFLLIGGCSDIQTVSWNVYLKASVCFECNHSLSKVCSTCPLFFFSPNLSCSSFNIFDVSLVDLVGWAAERGDLSRWPLKCQWDASSARVEHVKGTASKNPTVRRLERYYCYLESNMSDFFREVNNSSSLPGKHIQCVSFMSLCKDCQVIQLMYFCLIFSILLLNGYRYFN